VKIPVALVYKGSDLSAANFHEMEAASCVLRANNSCWAVILATALVAKYLNPDEEGSAWTRVAAVKGSALVGLRYEQLLPYALPYLDADQAFRVIAGDFVTTEDGTGIVHTAPTFGADDARVAAAAGHARGTGSPLRLDLELVRRQRRRRQTL
jgi:isoleucyl-tRNA synthetase